MIEYTADKAIDRRSIGPDWGEIEDKYAPVQEKLKVPQIQVMPSRMTIPTVSADWGYIPDRYAPKEQPANKVTANDLPDKLATKNIEGSVLTERGHVLKTKANGAELELEGVQGRGVVYLDANLPRPFISSIRGLRITMDRETSIGLEGRRQNRVIFEGRGGLVALGLTQFELNPETITIRSTSEAAGSSQSKTTPTQGTAA